MRQCLRSKGEEYYQPLLHSGLSLTPLPASFPSLPSFRYLSRDHHVSSQVFTVSSTHVVLSFTPFHWSLTLFLFLPPPVLAPFQLISPSSLPLTPSMVFPHHGNAHHLTQILSQSLSLFHASTSSKLNPPFSFTHLSVLSFVPSLQLRRRSGRLSERKELCEGEENEAHIHWHSGDRNNTNWLRSCLRY